MLPKSKSPIIIKGLLRFSIKIRCRLSKEEGDYLKFHQTSTHHFPEYKEATNYDKSNNTPMQGATKRLADQ